MVCNVEQDAMRELYGNRESEVRSIMSTVLTQNKFPKGTSSPHGAFLSNICRLGSGSAQINFNNECLLLHTVIYLNFKLGE